MQDEEEKKAIELLRSKGYRVSPIGKMDAGLYIIKQPIHNYRVQYSLRRHRTTLSDKREGVWKEGTMIAKIDEAQLKWEPIIQNENLE